ncbi:MAG: response regulator transcription factor [Candidatus Promineifilaceae bacterium]|nr:response regulator transcription factor [Candidatus Promineifilaceae bacterium]
MVSYILYVDDSFDRRLLLLSHLKAAEYEVRWGTDTDEVLVPALTDPPALVLMNIDMEEPLPLNRLRERYQIPLILLGSSKSSEDEIAGLRMGADDVLTDVDNRELVLARVHAALRRSRIAEGEADDLIVVGDLVLDAAARLVTVGGERVELSEREFRLLWTLAREAGMVLTREELLKRVWGTGFLGEPQTLYVYMSWLRKKLGAVGGEGVQIVTVHRKGYKLVPA